MRELANEVPEVCIVAGHCISAGSNQVYMVAAIVMHCGILYLNSIRWRRKKSDEACCGKSSLRC